MRGLIFLVPVVGFALLYGAVCFGLWFEASGAVFGALLEGIF